MDKKIDPKLMTKEALEKAMTCETPEALIAMAKEEGVELTAEEAKTYMEQIEGLDVELSDEQMKEVAGGEFTWKKCSSHRCGSVSCLGCYGDGSQCNGKT